MSAREKEVSQPELKGPFDSLRDYVAFLEQRGHLMRVEEIDQDRYEGTALMYRLGDEFGYDNSPSLLFERIKIDGRVIGDGQGRGEMTQRLQQLYLQMIEDECGAG